MLLPYPREPEAMQKMREVRALIKFLFSFVLPPRHSAVRALASCVPMQSALSDDPSLIYHRLAERQYLPA